MNPEKIKVRDKEFLDITWSSGEFKSLKLSNLRNHCPCAICHSEKDEWGATYIPLYTQEQLTITKINIIGNYAVGVEWKDGHNTGLYDYEYLSKLFDNYPIVKK